MPHPNAESPRERTSAEQIVVADSGGSIRVVPFGEDGRGVAALRPFSAGEVIERCPVLVIPESERAAIDATLAGSHIFMWGHGTTAEDIYTGRGEVVVVLGFASLLNHSAEPNCSIVRYIEARAVEVVAARDIEAGEELRFDYNMTLWFTPA